MKPTESISTKMRTIRSIYTESIAKRIKDLYTFHQEYIQQHAGHIPDLELLKSIIIERTENIMRKYRSLILIHRKARKEAKILWKNM